MEIMMIKKSVFLIIVELFIIVNNSCVKADIDHHFEIVYESINVVISQNQAIDCALSRLPLHSRVIYNQETKEFLFNADENVDKSMIDEHWRLADIQTHATLIRNSDSLLLWSVSVYVKTVRFINSHFIYCVVIDANSGSILEESFLLSEQVDKWEKQFGKELFWSIDTYALFDELYPEQLPPSWIHIRPLVGMIGSKEALNRIENYLQQYEFVSPDEWYKNIQLIKDLTDDQKPRVIYIAYYVQVGDNLPSLDFPYYYCEVDALTGELIYITYTEDGIFYRDRYPVRESSG